MSDSQFPTGGSNTKYIVGGLILLAGAIGLVLALKPAPAPPPEAAPPPPKQVERANPLADQNLIIEEDEEPDAGPPPEEVVETPKPRVKRPKRDAWDCSGDLDRAAISKVVASNRSAVRTCYERRLKVNSILQGDLRLKIKIGNGGAVTATQVSGSLRDNEVFACVRRVAKSWTFPDPKGNDCAVVDIPFQFSPKQ